MITSRLSRRDAAVIAGFMVDLCRDSVTPVFRTLEDSENPEHLREVVLGMPRQVGGHARQDQQSRRSGEDQTATPGDARRRSLRSAGGAGRRRRGAICGV